MPDGENRFVASLGVRPARAAVLVPKVKGWSWLAMFEGALAAQSRCWGGSANLLFPISGDMKDRDLFWALAERFDADTFVAYEPRYSDVAEILPAWYKAWVERQRAAFSEEHGEDTADDLMQQIASTRAIHGEFAQDWLAPIRRRLAPLYHHDNWIIRGQSGSDPPPQPLMDVTQFLEPPERVWSPSTRLGRSAQLLLTATLGRLTAATRVALEERDVAIATQLLDDKLSWSDAATGGRPNYAPYLAPWHMSNAGLSLYRRHGKFTEYSALVAGDTPWDFALFYALLRMTGQAWWLPSWLRRNQTYMWRLAHALEHDAPHEGRTAAVVSASSRDTARDVAAGLRTIQGVTGHLNIDAVDWRQVLPDTPLRPFETDNAGRAETFEVIDGETLPLPTPLPRQVKTKPATAVRWVTDMHGAEWTPLRHSMLGPKLLVDGFYESGNVRTGSDGIVYTCPNVIIFAGEGLEGAVARPRIRPAPLIDQVRTILEPSNWRVELSDKGIYASESASLFGSTSELVVALREPTTRAILDAYLSDKAPGQLLTDGRRYLSLRNVATVVDDDNKAKTTLRDLLARAVVERGLILGCERCRQKAWYDLGGVEATFACGRCHRIQDVEGHWGPSDEPPWFYRLAEVLYQFMRHDGFLPILAVHDMFSERTRFEQSYELDFFQPDGEKFEIDIVVSDGPRLWIGEATVTGSFEKGRLERVAEAAAVLDPYGLLLATSKRRWSQGVEAEAEKVFPGPRWPEVQLVTGVI